MIDRWEYPELGQIVETVLGGDWGKAPDHEDPDFVDVLCIRGTELRNWHAERGLSAAPRKIKKSSLAKRALKEGDIVLEVSGGGPNQPVGRVELIGKQSLAHSPDVPRVCTNFFRRLVLNDEVDPAYVVWFLKFFYSTGEIRDYQSGSNNLRNLIYPKYETILVPLPPHNEQQRIVEKIETLFARLDKGEEAVRDVQKLLTRYRQSILKSAVTGQLTADWRAKQTGALEHGRDILSRILETRRENWTGRGKYIEPSASKQTTLPELPDSWVWAKMEQLFEVYGGATPSRREPENWGGSIPWVSSGEVAFCRITDTKEKITDVGYQSCSTKLHPPGTILLAMIGEGKTRGQAAILDVAACNNQNAAAIRVSETDVPPEFIYFNLVGSYEANRLKGQGGNQPALNGAKVKGFDVPVCSIEEMHEFVRLVEERFASIAVTEVWCCSPSAPMEQIRLFA